MACEHVYLRVFGHICAIVGCNCRVSLGSRSTPGVGYSAIEAIQEEEERQLAAAMEQYRKPKPA
jgi:hypothetical protein